LRKTPFWRLDQCAHDRAVHETVSASTRSASGTGAFSAEQGNPPFSGKAGLPGRQLSTRLRRNLNVLSSQAEQNNWFRFPLVMMIRNHDSFAIYDLLTIFA
jgi:hypothetical protein